MSSYRILPLIALLFAAFPAHSASASQATEPAADNASEPRPTISMAEHRQQVGRRAMQILGILTAEITAQQGQNGEAYNHYRALFRRNRDQAVIERAVELALQSNHIAAARIALNDWQQHLPDAANNPNFKRLQWQLSCLTGDLSAASAGLPEALSEPQKHKLRANFRQLAQLLSTHPKIASPSNVEHIIQAARQHPDMAEAAIAAALFAAAQERESDSHAALHALQNHEHLDPNDLRLTLQLLQQRHPQQLQRFFSRHPVQRQHTAAWQTAYTLHLLQNQKLQEAYQYITQNDSSNAPLRLHAARLAIQLHQDTAAAQSHLEAAYQHSPSALKSPMLIQIVEQLLSQKQSTAAKLWLTRLNDADQQFTRHILAARIALMEHNTEQARHHIQQAQRQSKREPLPLLAAQLELDKLHNPQTAITKIEQMLAQPQTHLPADLTAEQRTTVLHLLRERHTLLLAEQPTRIHEAIATLRQRVQNEPDNPNALNALGYTMLSLPNPDLAEAHRHIEKAHRLAPDNSAIRDSLGWVLFKQGHPEQALPHLQAAYAEQADGEVAAHLIETLHQLGKHNDVQNLLRQLPIGERRHRIMQDTLQRLNIALPQ